MRELVELFKNNEEWLMRRILMHAKRLEYTRYTSTLEEAWRLSISGLTESLIKGAALYGDIPELGPDEDFRSDPLAAFGMVEARRHRERGVTIAMFLGLMKYYRLSYLELIAEKLPSSQSNVLDRLFVERCFDRIEIAFCQEWSSIEGEQLLAELQRTNRYMTNEKNTYLTAFESLSDPVMMLDLSENLINLNHAAAVLIDPHHIPGEQYYSTNPRKHCIVTKEKQITDAVIGTPVTSVFPWLTPTLQMLKEDRRDIFECELSLANTTRVFEVKRSDMLDVSEKLTFSIVILRDITTRKTTERELRRTVRKLETALSEVKRLTGLLPICSGCKKVRDDKGYWQQVETYLADHTDATFSHGMCPDCIKLYYPDIT